MSEPQEEWAEAPRRGGLVTALGVLNLVFGFLCGCVGAGYAVFGLVMPSLMEAGLKGAEAAIQTQRRQIVLQVEQADAELTAAPADSEDAASAQATKDRLEAQLTRLDQQDPAKALQAMRTLFGGSAMIGMFIGYASIALFWNLGLIIAAFGLFGRRSWARTMLLSLAAVKILLELGYGAWVVSTFPAAMNEMMAALPMGGPGGPTAAELAQIKSSMQMQGVFQGAIGSVLGAVYPAAVLIVLMLRSVRNEFEEWTHHRASGGRG